MLQRRKTSLCYVDKSHKHLRLGSLLSVRQGGKMFIIPATLTFPLRPSDSGYPSTRFTGVLSHVLTLRRHSQDASSGASEGGYLPATTSANALAASQHGDSHNCRNPNDVRTSPRELVPELQRNQWEPVGTR